MINPRLQIIFCYYFANIGHGIGNIEGVSDDTFVTHVRGLWLKRLCKASIPRKVMAGMAFRTWP